MDDRELDARAAQEIDENLRRVFKQMEGSDLPDRFTDLLRQLKEREQTSSYADAESVDSGEERS